MSNVMLAETLGRLYYCFFPVSPSSFVVVATLLLVIAATRVVAFSGIVLDPIQTLTGIHWRRLNQVLDTIEA